MLIRCPHCDHRILVRNARPRTYELSCPKCSRELYMLIEGEPGPDQRSAVFTNFEQMRKQILQAIASRPEPRRRTTDPGNRPESPEVVVGQSVDLEDADESEMDFVVPQRPDSPVSISHADASMVSDAASPEDAVLQDVPGQIPSQLLPHVVPVAFSSEDEGDQEPDLLQEVMDEVNEERMTAGEQTDADEPEQVSRPDSPREMEEDEGAVHRQRPEFAAVDEVIPTFPTDKQRQESHPDPGDQQNLLIMSADDIQAAEPRTRLNLSDDQDDMAAVDASMDEDVPVNEELDAQDNPQDPNHQKKGWRRWFGKD